MLSIIVPVYNVKKYLLDCLKSIDSQTFRDYEVVVVDDGSTDGSSQIIDEFCDDKSQFRVLHKENGGLMSAWTYGVENSKGEYLGFVDSDDMICPDMYEKMMNTAKYTNADIVMCGYRTITQIAEQNSIDKLNTLYNGSDIEFIHEHAFPSLKGGNISSARWNKIYKREIFVPNMKYCKDQSRFCEDRYIVPATLLTAKSFAYISEPLYIYRMRTSANSKRASKELMKSLEKLYIVQTQMLKDKGLLEKYKDNLEHAKLNYMKIAFERNLVNSVGKGKINMAKQILSESNRNIVIKNPEECVNKFGKILYWTAKLNLPIILVLAAELNKKLLRKRKENWFS